MLSNNLPELNNKFKIKKYKLIYYLNNTAIYLKFIKCFFKFLKIVKNNI